jgi:antitoxin component of MazEF toxin-antitoxin module
MTRNSVPKVKFISTVTRMGDDRYIRVPKKKQKEIESMEGKDIRVVVDDEFY